MTFTLIWAFTIVTAVSAGTSCLSYGLASSRDFPTQAECEAARTAYEADHAMRKQSPIRRLSTVPCEEKVRRP